MGKDAYDALRDELLLDAAIAKENGIKAQAKARGINLANRVQAAATGGGMTPTAKDAQFAFFQAQLDYLRAFIARKRIVTVPDYVGKMVIVTTPAFLQPVLPGPSMNPPPILSKEVNGVYFVPPPNPQMAKAAANGAIFEDFDRDRVLMTGAHEGFPDTSCSSPSPNTTTIRCAAFRSTASSPRAGPGPGVRLRRRQDADRSAAGAVQSEEGQCVRPSGLPRPPALARNRSGKRRYRRNARRIIIFSLRTAGRRTVE
ncbi:MAG TPA: hypothetical protein VGX91_12615 [Candidatus Cybelea sp.]|nr:hypothetical protein [Candidatus Cybelea sp.]